MATIDKPLPNVSETVVEVPKQEEFVEAREEIIEKKNQQGNVEVAMDEEGGAEIAFDPRAITEEGGVILEGSVTGTLNSARLSILLVSLMKCSREFATCT